MVNSTEIINKSAQVAVEQSNKVSEIWLVIGIFALLSLAFLLFFIFLTPIGKESVGRWKNKKLYAKGGYTNALIFTKDGLCTEVFIKNHDGRFVFDENSYVRVPKLSFPFKGIPTLAYIEGTPAPIDIYSRDRDNLISANELDTVMHQQMNFDFKEWFARNRGYILLGFAIIVGALAISLYFNYTMFEWIRDSAPQLKEGVSEIVQSKVV